MRARLADVALRAGVSTATVSRVFNDHPNVRPEMRARVMKAATDVNYEADFIGQSLRRRTTRSIGFVVRDISSPLFADIVKGAESVFQPAGYTMLLANSGGDPALGVAHIDNFRRRRVDGLILSLESEFDADTNSALRTLDIPVVLVDRDLPEPAPRGLRITSVVCDHRHGVRAATAHLIELGHRRIAFCAAPLNIRATRDRVAGFEEAFTAAGVEVPEDSLQIAGGHTEVHGATAMEAILAAPERATAIVCAGLQLTIGAIAALRRAGIDLGSDLSFVTCDQASFLELVQPPVSRIERDRELMGATAAELMLKMLSSPRAPRRLDRR